jgi:hypothetical protein
VHDHVGHAAENRPGAAQAPRAEHDQVRVELFGELGQVQAVAAVALLDQRLSARGSSAVASPMAVPIAGDPS